MKLLIYSEPNEPVTAVLLKNAERLELNTINLKQLLDDVTIFDTIEDGVVNINWELSKGFCITNSDDVSVINRVYSVPKKLFNLFHRDDREYAQAEFYAYLQFAFQAFPNIDTKPGAYGLSNGYYPLPRMWSKIDNSSIGIKVPQCYMGNPYFVPSSWNKNDIIEGGLLDYYQWKPTNSLSNKNSVFVYLRPAGEPHFVSISYGSYQVIAMVNGKPSNLPKVIQDRLICYAEKINQLFTYSFGEILFFVNKNKITFAMISPSPIGISKSNLFEKLILSAFGL